MRKTENATHIEGFVYEHKLEARTSGPNSKNPGTPFIMGTLDIVTDDALTNVVSVHFTYVTPTYAKSGKTNTTYTVLEKIVNGDIKSVTEHGKENAGRVRIDSAIGVNDFYTDRNGEETLVSAKRNEGGFVHEVTVLNNDEKTRNTFKADMLITNVRHIDADEDRKTAAKAIVKGYVFDYSNSLLPVEFSAINPNAMNYFEDLGVTGKEPVFTKVWGRQISETIVRQIVEESAFGEDNIREVSSSRKDWVITGASKEPYPWDEDGSITAAEVKDALAKREVYLATVKQRQDEYKASKSKATNEIKSGDFKF